MTNILLWLWLPKAKIFKWFRSNSQIFQRFSMRFNYNQLMDWLQQVLQHLLYLLQLQYLHQSTMRNLRHIYISTFFNNILPKINFFQLLSKLSIVAENYKIHASWLVIFQPISALNMVKMYKTRWSVLKFCWKIDKMIEIVSLKTVGALSCTFFNRFQQFLTCQRYFNVISKVILTVFRRISMLFKPILR
jgi:hypothetical protein